MLRFSQLRGCAAPCADENKTAPVCLHTGAVRWVARVDCASRASKKAPLGLFCPPDCTAGRCCSNPPAFVSFTHIQNKKLQRNSYVEAFLVGAGGFEPPKLKSSRFTVCPHWPLGNTPIFFSQSVPDCLYILPLPRGFVKFFAANYFAGMRAASSQKKNTRTLNGFRCLKWSW